MERFVQAIVAGGLALVAGLWLFSYFGAWSMPWSAGLVLVGLGVGGLGYGIWRPVEY